MSKLKYYTEFSDAYKNRYRVEILNDSYTGPAGVMELGGEAVVINRPQKKITEPLFSMGATIQVWCNKNFEYADLFSTSEQTNQVVIARNNEVIFRGWVEPNLYEEEYMAPPYLITIPASDGLAALENYYPERMNEKKLSSLLMIIKRCLNCTGFNLPVNIVCGLNPDKNTDNRLFESSFVELESLRNYKDGVYEYDNAKDLLEDILKPFSCRIYQSGDEWYIERIKDRIAPTVKWVRYNTDDTSSVVTRTPSVSLDTANYMFMSTAATLQIDAGYGRQTIKADANLWDTVIAGNFEAGIIHLLNVIPNSDYIFDFDYRQWYSTGIGISAEPYSDAEIKQGVRLLHTGATGRNNRVWQHARITANNEDEIEISFKITIEPGTKEAYKGRYLVSFQSKTRKRGDNITLSLNWKKDGDTDPIYKDGVGPDYLCEGIYVKSEDWKDGFPIPVKVSFSAKLGLRSDFFDVNDLAFVVMPVMADVGKGGWSSSVEYIRSTIIGDIEIRAKEKKEYDNTFTATINRRYMRKAEDIDIRFWTLPSKYTNRMAANYNFKNGLMKTDYTAIRGISCPAEGPEVASVPERLLIDNFDQYYDPRDSLSGEVMCSGFISPDQHYTVASRPGKNFLLTGMDADLKDATYEVNIEEIKPHQISTQ